jgi:intracellular septation protein A
MKKIQQHWLSFKIHTIWRIELIVMLIKNGVMQNNSHDENNKQK